MTSSSIYVVYLTTYGGSNLPPFYIGSTSAAKIQKGYGGSVSSKRYRDRWLQARRDEATLFKTVVLSEHTTREAAIDAERTLHEQLDVVKSPLFINMAVAGLHHNCSGRTMSDKTRVALAAANTGRRASDATREKMKKARALRPSPSAETRARMAEASKRRVRAPMSEETKGKISEAAKQRPPPTPKSLAKRSATQKARCSTPEAKAKLSAAGKARWAKRPLAGHSEITVR